jgi:hypothetical protein
VPKEWQTLRQSHAAGLPEYGAASLLYPIFHAFLPFFHFPFCSVSRSHAAAPRPLTASALYFIGAFRCASVGDDWLVIFDYGVADFDRHDFAENGLTQMAS